MTSTASGHARHRLDKVRKGYVGKRPRTWLSLTAAGRTAFDRHLAALRAIAEGST
jgi:Winged helix DNA-binding domain